MAVTCPVDLDVTALRAEVQAMYANVATAPEAGFHFHLGPAYAATVLGYDAVELSALPAEVTASFAGIGNPLAIGPLRSGETVLDVGCGAGMDLLLAARRVGSAGHAIGVDMTAEMRERASAGAAALGLSHVHIRAGDAASLPLADHSVDVVMSNGVINLVPDKPAAYREIFRVLKPEGRFLYADIVVAGELPESIRRNIDLWTG